MTPRNDDRLAPLGEAVVDLDLWELLVLKHLLPGSTASGPRAAMYRDFLEEIKQSILRYALATLKALYGPEDTWALQRSELILFVRNGLVALLRAYASCVRAAFTDDSSDATAFSRCCLASAKDLPGEAAASLPATCAHALSFLTKQTAKLKTPIKQKAMQEKLARLATSDEARDHYAAVVRALVKLHLIDK